MKNIVLALILGFIPFTNFAQVNGDVQKLILKGIYERSPLGRYQAKDFSPGIKNFRDDARCVQNDLDQVFKMQNPPMAVRFPGLKEILKDSAPNERTKDFSLEIEDFELQLRRELKDMLGIYTDSKDSLADKREICSISGIFAAPNAVSIGYGFMVFDPNIFYLIARSENATAWSLRAVLAHELAHQFQVWNQDAVLMRMKDGKLYARDKELQADCVAAALLQKMHDDKKFQPDPTDNLVAFDTARDDAFIKLGDFKFEEIESHHGTAWERKLMANVGKWAANDLRAKKNDGIVPVLNYCRAYIDQMNKKFSDSLWPMGSQLQTFTAP